MEHRVLFLGQTPPSLLESTYLREVARLAKAASVDRWVVDGLMQTGGRLSINQLREEAKRLPTLASQFTLIVACGEAASRACKISGIANYVSVAHPTTFSTREGKFDEAVEALRGAMDN
jgi:hypothetical protein